MLNKNHIPQKMSEEDWQEYLKWEDKKIEELWLEEEKKKEKTGCIIDVVLVVFVLIIVIAIVISIMGIH